MFTLTMASFSFYLQGHLLQDIKTSLISTVSCFQFNQPSLSCDTNHLTLEATFSLSELPQLLAYLSLPRTLSENVVILNGTVIPPTSSTPTATTPTDHTHSPRGHGHILQTCLPVSLLSAIILCCILCYCCFKYM